MNRPARVAVSAAAIGTAPIAIGAWRGIPLRALADLVAARIEAASNHSVTLGSPLQLEVWPTPSVVAHDLVVRDSADRSGLVHPIGSFVSGAIANGAMANPSGSVEASPDASR